MGRRMDTARAIRRELLALVRVLQVGVAAWQAPLPGGE